jgi:prepilin-type N-terminal cleavage/methylation domain-containing protein
MKTPSPLRAFAGHNTRHQPHATRHGGPAAFTLIELLVVVSVIVVLAALALPAVTGALRSARNAEVRAMANQIKLAISSYHTEYGTYPNVTNANMEFMRAMTGETNVSSIPNRRGIRFLEIPSKFSNSMGIVTPAGFYRNRTERRTFNIHNDTNYDGRLQFNSGSRQEDIAGSAAVWVADPHSTNIIGTW